MKAAELRSCRLHLIANVGIGKPADLDDLASTDLIDLLQPTLVEDLHGCHLGRAGWQFEIVAHRYRTGGQIEICQFFSAPSAFDLEDFPSTGPRGSGFRPGSRVSIAAIRSAIPMPVIAVPQNAGCKRHFATWSARAALSLLDPETFGRQNEIIEKSFVLDSKGITEGRNGAPASYRHPPPSRVGHRHS